MIMLYRYVKKKQQEKEQERKQKEALEANGGVPPPPPSHEHASSTGTVDAVQPVEKPSPATAVEKPSLDWGWILRLGIALAIPTFLETLDYTVVATAQTNIASAFNRLDLQSYVGTSFLLTSTVFLPFFASVADIFGRYPALQISSLFFIAGSALSTGARNMEMMLAGRGIAGIGAAGMLALVRIILADSGSLQQNNWQVALMFILYTIGFCTGPSIGGALVRISFRWVFAINLPTTLLAMVLAFLLLRTRLKKGDAAASGRSFVTKLLLLDWIGTLLFVASGILILLALNWGSTAVWNTTKVIVSFVIGGILFILFITWEYILERAQESGKRPSSILLSPNPMLPLEIMRSYDVLAVQYGSFVSGMVMMVMFYFVAIFFTVVTGLSPLRAGVQLIYFAPGMGGGTLIAMRLIKWTKQPKVAIILGSGLLPVSLGLISMAMEANKEAQVNGFMVMAGVGVGMTSGSLVVHARFTQPRKRVAIVSAMILFFRSFGGTIGLAQCSAVLNAKVRQTIIDSIKSGVISPDTAASLAQANSKDLSSLNSIASLPPDVQAAVRNAFKEGSRWAFISLVPWGVLAFAVSLFLSRISAPEHEHQVAEFEEKQDREEEERRLQRQSEREES